MKLAIAASAFVLLTAAGAAMAAEDQPSGTGKSAAAPAGEPGPFASASESTTVTAKVKNVDLEKRQVTLVGPDANEVTLTAGPNIRNLDQVKKGDTVRIDFDEAVAILRTGKGGDAASSGSSSAPPAATSSLSVQSAEKGATPGGTITKTVDLNGRVVAVDRTSRMVTIEGPLGNQRAIKAGEEAGSLDNVQPGDNVALRYTQAARISLVR